MATAKKKKEASGSATPPAFEDALDGLEMVIGELEGGDLTLVEALERFEEGVRLMRHCDGRLRHARGRLAELLRGEDGELVAEVLGEGLETFGGGMADDE